MQPYQPEIEGLRAIAVLAVLLFHLNIPGFSGGFVGVDMFFVVSGYLITKNIYRDLESEKFSFKTFYLRRIYRLVPALLVTIAVTLVASSFILTPEHFAKLGMSSVASVFSVSNFLFWSEAGYFDEAKTFKPLLHTWSLAVEEQFYLLWPILLFFLYSKGKKFRLLSLTILAIISLYATESFLSNHNAMAFYWMPFRISEFAIGAVLVFSPRISCSSWWVSVVGGLGLALILVPIVIYSEQTIFPGMMALLPCLGTALLIRFGGARIIFPLLANHLFRHLGKISYSLYLVHWPVIVLVSYWKLGGIGAKSLVVVLPLIFLLAWALHYKVEQRFRLSKSETDHFKRGYVIASFALITILFGTSVSVGKGWPWRYSAEAKVVMNAVDGLDTNNGDKRRLIDEYQLSFRNQKNIARHYIIGDSFAEDTMLAIKFSIPDLNLKLLSIRAECQPVLPSGYGEAALVSRSCDEERKKAFNNPELKDANTIYLAASWREPAFSKLPEAIEFLNNNTSAKIVVIGSRAGFHDVPTLAVRYGNEVGLNEFVNQFKSVSVTKNNGKLRRIADDVGARFIDVYPIMCPNSICTIISPLDKKIIYSDNAHLTIAGAKHLAKGLLKEIER
jgi:peptidoglycan/LPS O-acetylase OafA/YrhL